MEIIERRDVGDSCGRAGVVRKQESPATELIVGLLLRCRRAGDWSQRDLAALLGVDASTVARWETGERAIDAVVLLDIAALAGYELALVGEPVSLPVDPPVSLPVDSSGSLPAARSDSLRAEPCDGPAVPGPTPHLPSAALPPCAPVPPPAHGGRLSITREEAADLEYCRGLIGMPPVLPSDADRRDSALAPEHRRLVRPWPVGQLRDRTGRRLPAHLDAFFHQSHDLSPENNHGFHVCSPRRPRRTRMRLFRTPHELSDRLHPANLSERSFMEMPTQADMRQWIDDLRERNDLINARSRATSPTEPSPDCWCEIDCHENITCIASCPCQCEPAAGAMIRTLQVC